MTFLTSRGGKAGSQLYIQSGLLFFVMIICVGKGRELMQIDSAGPMPGLIHPALLTFVGVPSWYLSLAIDFAMPNIEVSYAWLIFLLSLWRHSARWRYPAGIMAGVSTYKNSHCSCMRYTAMMHNLMI